MVDPRNSRAGTIPGFTSGRPGYPKVKPVRPPKPKPVPFKPRTATVRVGTTPRGGLPIVVTRPVGSFTHGGLGARPAIPRAPRPKPVVRVRPRRVVSTPRVVRPRVSVRPPRAKRAPVVKAPKQKRPHVKKPRRGHGKNPQVGTGYTQPVTQQPDTGYEEPTLNDYPDVTDVLPSPPEMSPQQDIQAMIEAAYRPSFGALDQSQRMGSQQIADATKAYLAELGPLPGQIGDDYSRVIGQQTEIANQGAAALRAASPVASVQGDMAAVNAPQAQQQQVASELGQTFNGGAAALFGLQGYEPANRLSRDELAQMTYTRGLPSIVAAQGQQQLGAFLREVQQSRAKLAADMAQQVPEYQMRADEMRLNEAQYRADYLLKESELRSSDAQFRYGQSKDEQSFLYGQAKDQQDYDLKASALALNQRIASKQLGLKTKTAKASIRRGKALTRQGNKRLKLSQQGLSQGNRRLKLSELHADRDWQATLTRLGIAKQSERRQAAALELRARNGGISAVTQVKWRAQAHSIAAQYGNSATDPKTGKVHPPLPYRQTIRQIMAKGIPYSLARKAANAFYRPGQHGRPGGGGVTWRSFLAG